MALIYFYFLLKSILQNLRKMLSFMNNSTLYPILRKMWHRAHPAEHRAGSLRAFQSLGVMGPSGPACTHTMPCTLAQDHLPLLCRRQEQPWKVSNTRESSGSQNYTGASNRQELHQTHENRRLTQLSPGKTGGPFHWRRTQPFNWHIRKHFGRSLHTWRV